MKRLFTFLLGIGTLLSGAISAYAENAEVISARSDVENQFQIQTKAAQTGQAADFILEKSPALKLTVSSDTRLTAPKSARPQRVRANASRKVKAADLNGNFVGTYSTLTTSSFDGGSSMQIVPDAQGDSITIKYFWNGEQVRAHVNPETGIVTIPRQRIFVDPEVGPLDIAVAKKDGKPDYTAQITGKVTADGIDLYDAWWGVFVQQAGKYKDLFVGAYTNTMIRRATGTFQYQRKGTDGQMADYGFYVLIDQPTGNTLTITNIFNRGLEVTALLNRDRTAEISNQVAMINSSGSWTLIKCVSFNDAGNLTSYSPIIVTDKAEATNNNTLSWTDWSLLCTQASSYAGKLENARLTAMTPFSYPVLSESSFEGEGTEASPYLIKNRDHLILLADQVNNNTVQTGEYYNNPVYSLYNGKHFALANDIDLGGYRLDPIGWDLLHRFGGTLDGKGHTLKNVYVEGGSKYYAGLFGVCDTVAVIKNLNIENLKVNSDYFYTGGVVSWNCGSMDNVNVINPEITSARSLAGGIVGIAIGPVSNCSVKEGIIITPMYAAGAVAEAHGGISNVSVYGTRINMTGSGAPSGGVVANLLSDGTKLSFSGLLQYYQNGDQQFLGGVAGMLQKGTLSKSFSGGVVRGYSSDSYVGGLVGYCRGYVEDCYSAGVVHCYSRMTGGLIGVISSMNGVTTPTVRNSYTSAFTSCETYQYNRENCAEVIGKILDGTTPVLENIYANRQITNFYSTRFASNTAELTAAAGPKGFSAENWVFTEGAYPRVKGLEDTQAAQYTASAVDFSPIDNVKKLSNNTPLKALGNTEFFFNVGGKLSKEGHYAKIVDNKMIEISSNFGADTLYMVNGSVQTYMFLAIAPIPFEGEGTEHSPFLIKTKADLVALSEATTDKGQTFPNLYFRQTNDIDMELTEDFLVIAGKPSDAYNKFEGVYDGAGYTIDNLNVANRVAWTTPISAGKLGTLNTSLCKSYAGLFGRLGENGIVRNVTIGAGSKLNNMYGTSGAIVGNSAGLVENCRNYAYVHGYSCWIGGIVGKTEKGAVIRNCYNAGRVTTCYANAGGIVGSSTNATVENCVNTGDVEVLLLITNYATNRKNTGGIAGGTTTGSVYRNNINYGTVSALLNNAGGLIANLETSTSGKAELHNSINVGNVYCGNPATLGAIAGIIANPTVSGVYYDNQNIGLPAGQNADIEGVTPATTAFLTSGNAIEGFDTELWDFKAGMYPALKQFANEPKVQAARKVYVSMPENVTVADMLATGTLSEGATWSLADGKVFKIEGNSIVGLKTVETVVTDTLKAVNAAGVVRPILLTAKPSIPLTGEGTEAKPYLVNNLNDWKALCSFIDMTNNSLEGMFVNVTADLDFTGETKPARLGANGVTPFAGILDFKNHVIKNITLKPAANTDCALIGTVSTGGAVKNLTFEGTVTAAYTYAAPLVDKLYGTLENIESKANVTTTKAYASGVVANAYDGAVFNKVKFSGTISSNQTYIAGIACVTAATGKTTFQDCAFTGKIKATAAPTKATAMYVGGLVANCGSAEFTNCYSDGSIELSNTTFTTTVGGLVANATGNSTYKDYIFTNCYNATPITAGGKIAGLVGGTPTSATAGVFKFTDCYNTGDISAKATKAITSAPTAGIIVNYTPGSVFTRCHNEGTLISDKNVYTGGIVGQNTGTPGSTATPDKVLFNDCWNEGMIIADGNQGGGIAGYINGTVILTNCYNTADLEGGQMVGGITSAFAGTGPQMINCYNTGNITTKLGRAAGLIAWGGPTNGLVKGCWNTGNISSTATVGGTSAANGAWAIGGLAAAQSATFEDCYNAGSVKGLARVGGLVGDPTKGKTSFKNCYNAGALIAPADTCGHIVGANITNGKIWSADNKVENCYFIDNKESTLPVPEGATAVTVAELAGKTISNGFTVVDAYTFPVVAGFEKNVNAVFNAAQLIPAKDNTLEHITKAFNVGGSPTVAWTSDCAALAFSGTDAKFTADYAGKVKVTATAGDLTKSYDLTVDAKSGVDGLDADNMEVVSVRYYNAAGVEVAKPDTADGQVYITVTRYADGTEKVAKIVNVK